MGSINNNYNVKINCVCSKQRLCFGKYFFTTAYNSKTKNILPDEVPFVCSFKRIGKNFPTNGGQILDQGTVPKARSNMKNATIDLYLQKD